MLGTADHGDAGASGIIRGVANRDSKWREVERGAHVAAGLAAAAAAASRFAWHVRQRVMPRMSQITQMNVPQSTHG